ncbi:MAG TPA: hypothetical protein VFJ71_07030 [Candidatus Limnocylindrales bacterium]|nr:hypothetical protein [Candidatus Limnocylindrales bacterium]
MDRTLIATDPAALRLRRVGRLARRRMRIDGDDLRNGTHTDGTLTIEISGLGSPVAGIPDSFEWEADRPIALVIVRSGIDGEDVDFQVGPSRHGISRGAGAGDGTGIRYVAFCYDAAPAPAVQPAPADVPAAAAVETPVAAPVSATPARRRLAAASAFAPTGRDRRSILGMLLSGSPVRRAAI